MWEVSRTKWKVRTTFGNIMSLTVQYCDSTLKNYTFKYCTYYQVNEYSNLEGSKTTNIHSHSLQVIALETFLYFNVFMQDLMAIAVCISKNR